MNSSTQICETRNNLSDFLLYERAITFQPPRQSALVLEGISWDTPHPSDSHSDHQDYYISNRGIPINLHLPLLLGGVSHHKVYLLAPWRPIPMDRSLWTDPFAFQVTFLLWNIPEDKDLSIGRSRRIIKLLRIIGHLGVRKLALTSLMISRKNILPWIGQIIIFHQSRFPWKSGDFPKPQLHFGAQVVWGRSFIGPAWMSTSWVWPCLVTVRVDFSSLKHLLKKRPPHPKMVCFQCHPKSKKLLLDENKRPSQDSGWIIYTHTV